MTDVKCLVEECKYNQSYYCNAKGIEVRSNGATQVKSASETACETFACASNSVQG